MLTQNGQNGCFNGNRSKTVNGFLTVELEISDSFNSAEEEFFDYIKFHGIEEFINSLKMVHDFALYHTDLCFDTKEKKALFDLKILWEGFERLGQES